MTELTDNSTEEQTERTAESIAQEHGVNGRILARAYRSIGDRAKLLEGLSHIRERLLAVVQQIDRLRQDVEQD